MTNTPMKSQNTLERRPGAVMDTVVAERNVPSVDRAKYFVTFSEEAFGRVSACHMKTKGEPAELLKPHIRWVERQTNSRVK